MKIASRPSILKLNANWQPIGFTTPQKAFPDMVTGALIGLHLSWRRKDGDFDFSVPEEIWAINSWNEWLNLPIREYDDYLNTPNMRVRIPKITITPKFNKMPRVKTSMSKSAIFERDNYQCQYTGLRVDPAKADELFNVDHIIPKSRGGSGNWNNVVTSLKTINFKKDNKTPDEAGLRLLKSPKQPREKTLMECAKEQARKARHLDNQHTFFIK